MSAQDLANASNAIDAPAARFAAVTPSPDTDMAFVSRALWVGTGGNLVVTNHLGAEVTFANVPDGTLLPIRAARVDDSSTAADIVALW